MTAATGQTKDTHKTCEDNCWETGKETRRLKLKRKKGE